MLRAPGAVVHLLHVEKPAQVQSGDGVVRRAAGPAERAQMAVAAHGADHIHAAILDQFVYRKPSRLAP